jgi:hypothetical protein
MTRRRLVAAVLAAAVSVGSSVLAACELVCALGDAPAAAAQSAPQGCHENSPAKPGRCSERHTLRLAVVDSAVSPALAAPQISPAPWMAAPLAAAGLVRPTLDSSAPPSASPPLILRV